MKEIAIDGKIIECDRFLIITNVHREILKELKKPTTQTELSEIFKGYISQSTLVRSLQRMVEVGIINYKFLDGRTKEFRRS